MSYSENIYYSATLKMIARRNSALYMADYRKEEVYKEIPRIAEIETLLSDIGISTAKAVLSGKDVVAQLTSLKEKSLALQDEMKRLLLENGYSEDYLEPQFSCKKCNDTGYIELENKTVNCECFKKLLSDTACEELNKVSPLSLSTFDSFNLNFYSGREDENGNIPYIRMNKIYSHCLNYAKTFTKDSKSLLLMGLTGLGKTHLSLAIANEVIEKGYSVVYVSVPDILSKLESEHFSYGYSNEQEILNSLYDCDLLILDDLGTEFSTQFSSTAIYNIFNTRINMGKPLIVNTNLSIDELAKTYTRRFTSRLTGCSEVLEFIGKDIRLML